MKNMEEEKLSFKQKEGIKSQIKSGNFSENELIKSVMDLGFNEATAISFLSKIIKDLKEELYYKLKEEKELEERGNIAMTVTIIVSLLVGVMGRGNSGLIILSVIVACFAGFLGFPKKPIAGLAGCLVGAVLMPIVAAFYLKGRNSFFTLEMIIPIAISFGPALLIKYLVSKLMYSDDND